ncbi:MAG: hypothetical protein ACREQC_00350, partial [Candidatus Binataceae bacterium]
FGGALLGMFIRDLLPEHHLSKDSQDVVKLGMGLIGTMSALVLGFLVASAQGSYATRGSELTQMAANTVLLDRVLAHYGTETKDARDLLRNAVAIVLEQTWREGSTEAAKFDPTAARAEGLYDLINQLTPRNEAQRSSQAEALTIALNLAQMRWLLFEQSRGSIPMPFLVILGFWLCIIFVSFGLFAPSNGTVIATLLVCALSVAGAIFLILELDRPFEGLMQISSAPLHNALSHLGR